MAFDESLRQVKELLLRGVAALFVGRVMPTTITLVAYVMGMGCAVAVSRGLVWKATVLWWLNRILDGLDGVVARAANQQTSFGAYVDIVCDFCVYAAIPLAYAWKHAGPSASSWATVCALEAVCFVNAASLFMLSGLLERQKVRQRRLTTLAMPRSLVEGFETMVVFQLFIWLSPDYVFPMMNVFSALVGLTVLYRVYWAYKVLE